MDGGDDFRQHVIRPIHTIAGGFKRAAQPRVFVHHGENRGVDEQVGGVLLVLRLHRLCGELQAVGGEQAELPLVTGEKTPAAEIRAKMSAEPFHLFRRVKFRVGRERDEPGVVVVRQQVLD